MSNKARGKKHCRAIRRQVAMETWTSLTPGQQPEENGACGWHRQETRPARERAGSTVWSSAGSTAGKLESSTTEGSSRKESFFIPLKCIDVSRITHTNLDVKQWKRINDYWNIDGSKDLSDPWTGFIQFILSEEDFPEVFMWSGWRLTRIQLTSRPDHLWSRYQA